MSAVEPWEPVVLRRWRPVGVAFAATPGDADDASTPDDIPTLLLWPFIMVICAVLDSYVTAKWKIVVYRRKPGLLRRWRPVGVAFAATPGDADDVAAATRSQWTPGQFANAEPLSHHEFRALRRRAERDGSLAQSASPSNPDRVAVGLSE